MLFRIAQEALTNIERHAQASRIAITLSCHARRVTLAIRDDGVGFDPVMVAGHMKRGIGLRNMLERMELIGGQLDITSSPAGTAVLASVALPA
jgi:two-component system NarL family sensor kinase